MRKAALVLALLVLLAITLCPSVSYSRMITLDIGEVVNTGRAYNEWIAWLWVPESKRIEPKTREAVCQWGWVKVKQSEE